MNDRTWAGRALRVMLVVVMVLPFIGYFAPAASAHHPILSVDGGCAPESGEWTVTWTVANGDWYGRTMTVDQVTYSDGQLTDIKVGLVLGPNATESDTVHYPLSDTSTKTLTVRADWSGGGPQNVTTSLSIDLSELTDTGCWPPEPGSASLTVVKVVDTADAPAALFPFTMTDEAAFSLGDAGSKSHTYVLDPAESTLDVSATEGALPANWSFVSASCKNSAGASVGTVVVKSASVTLSDGDDVTCTFHNEYIPPEPGSASLTVVKVVDTVDAPAASFPFTMTGEAGFSLADAGSKSHTYVLDPAESTHDVSAAEGALPANWSFVSASCKDPAGASVGTVVVKSASVTLSDGDDITCTFHNKYTPPHTPSGTIVIRKITQGSVGTFGFDLVEHYEGDVSNAFDLTTVTQGVAVDKVFAGMSVLSWYSVSEDSLLPARWALTSASCVSDIEGQPVPEEFSLSDGETVTCTFVNTYTPPREPELGSIGDFVWDDGVSGTPGANGVQEAGEPGVAGVTVRLLDGSGAELDSTVTDANGKYLFSGLSAGDYQVEFIIPDRLDLYGFTAKGNGTPETGSDADLSSLGRTVLISLGAGVNDMSWDAGLVQAQVSPTTVVNTTTTAPPETLPFTGPTSTGVGGFGVAMVLLGGLVLLAFRKKDDPVVERGFARRLDS